MQPIAFSQINTSYLLLSPPSPKPFVLRALLLTAVTGVSVACGDSRKVEAESRQLAAAWAAAAEASVPRETVTTVSPQKPALFIDASRSMAGFAGCSVTPTAYNITLDRITTSLGITEVTRFGETTRGEGRVFEVLPLTKPAHCPPFYNRLQNPDYALFAAAAADSSGRVYLYLTDGVQSDWQGRNPGPSVAALKQWIDSGRGLAILGFRSAFSGPLWSEQRQVMLGRASSDARPFYLFVLGRTDGAVDDVISKLSPALLRQSTKMRFANDAVRCRAFSSVPEYVSGPAERWSMFQLEDVRTISSVLSYSCRFRDYPVNGIRPRISGQYRRWIDGMFTTPDALPLPVGQGGRATLEGDSMVVPLEIGWKNTQTTRFGLYEMRFHAEPGELSDSITALSTDTDATLDTVDKTYRFSWLLEELMRTHLRRLPWTPYSVTIQYR